MGRAPHRHRKRPTSCTSASRKRAPPNRRPRPRMRAGSAERYRLPFVDLSQFSIDHELFRAIPADLMLRYGFVPYRREGTSLVIVVSDPTDLPMIDELAVLLATPIKVTVGTPSAIQAILKKSESSQRVLEEATESFQLQILREDELADDQLTRRQADRGPESGHPAGRHDALFGDSAPRQRHPHRDAGRCGAREVPDRRRAAGGDAADRQALSQHDHLARQGHGGARHRREARAAGRPLQGADGRQEHRLPRLDHAERPRRGRRHPYPRQGVDQRAVPRAAARHPRASRKTSCGGSASTSPSRTAWCW